MIMPKFPLLSTVASVGLACFAGLVGAGCKGAAATRAEPSASAPVQSASTAPAPSASGSPSASETDAALSAAPSAPAAGDATAAARRGSDAFAVRVLRGMPPSSNLFFSPESIRIALAMAYAGARGETAKEMAQVLGESGPPGALQASIASELAAFAAQESPRAPAGSDSWVVDAYARRAQTLRVVSRLWGQQGKVFVPEFLSVLDRSYAAPLEQLDFAGDLEGSRGAINRWVDGKTEHKIPELIARGALSGASRLVLTNAVYFKAAWSAPFVAGNTTDAPFAVTPTRSVTTKMMRQVGHFKYARVDQADVIELPYASGTTSMLVVVPIASSGLAAIEAKIDDRSLGRWAGAVSHKKVDFSLPRFKMSSGFSLRDQLVALGMKSAFEFPKADFSGMDGTRELFISDVIHKAFIATDEAGTEAAAATAVLMAAGAAPMREDPVVVRADHPFLIVIREISTGAPLFVGRVADPTPR